MLPSTGPISFDNLRQEYGQIPTVPLGDFYAGKRIPKASSGKLGLIPSSGALSMNMLRGSEYKTLGKGSAWTVTSSSDLGTTCSNPATDGGDKVMYVTSSGTQSYVYRSVDGGASFARVDPAKARMTGTLYYSDGAWHMVSTSLVVMSSYDDGATWAYTAQAAPIPADITPATTSNYNIYYWQQYSGISVSSLTGWYYSCRTTVYTPIPIPNTTLSSGLSQSSSTTYGNTGILGSWPPALLQHPVADMSSNSIVYNGANYIKCVNGVIQTSIYGTTWTPGQTLYLGGLPCPSINGKMYYEPSVGFILISLFKYSYNGSTWSSVAGFTIFASQDGVSWSNTCEMTQANFYTAVAPGIAIPANPAIMLVDGSIVFIFSPAVEPMPVLKSADQGATWTACALTMWPTGKTFAGTCVSATKLVAVGLNIQAFINRA